MKRPLLAFDTNVHPTRESLHVDLAMLLETRFLVQGSSRSGKTWMLYSMLQQTFGQVMHLVFDREADFLKLRQEYPYMIVGPEGDVPIDLKSKQAVETLIREVLRLKLSTIFDLSDLDEHQRHEFVKRAFNELADLPRSSGLYTPALVVLDEAHAFAPEKGQGEAVSAAAVASVASRGAKRGFCLVAATQRLAALSKGVADLCENKLILRTGGENLKRAARDLGFAVNAETQAMLRSLDRGVGYVYGPAIGAVEPIEVEVPNKLKVEPPKRGELKPPPPPPADAVRRLVAKLPDATAAHAAEAHSLAEANATIRRLQAELKRGGKGDFDAAAVQRQVDAAVAEARQHALTLLRGRTKLIDTARKALVTARAALDVAHGSITKADEALTEPIPDLPPVGRPIGAITTVPARIHGREVDVARPVARNNGDTAIPRSMDLPAIPIGMQPRHLKVLNAIARLQSLGLAYVKRGPVAVLAESSPTSSGYEKTLSQLSQMSMIRYPSGGTVQLTSDGEAFVRSHLNSFDTPPTLDSLHEAWRKVLDPRHWKIMEVLAKYFPGNIDRVTLAEESGQSSTSSGYEKTLSQLRAQYGLIDYPAPNRVVATDIFFPPGLS